MKRRRSKICLICDGRWDDRQLRTEQKTFNALNPTRDRSSNQPLNEAQRSFLEKNFRTSAGPLRDICSKHCCELAGISSRSFYYLINEFSLDTAGTHFTLEKPPKKKVRRVAPNATPLATITAFKEWCNTNSFEVPNSVKIRRFNAPLTSKRKAQKQFNTDKPEHRVCYTTFCSLLAHHCPGLKVFSLFFQIFSSSLSIFLLIALS